MAISFVLQTYFHILNRIYWEIVINYGLLILLICNDTFTLENIHHVSSLHDLLIFENSSLLDGLVQSAGRLLRAHVNVPVLAHGNS